LPSTGWWPCGPPEAYPGHFGRPGVKVEERMAQEGTVRWFSEEKGYGFISPDDGGEDLFVHYIDIEGSGFRSLQEGERVAYEVATQGARGPRAINVRKRE
jgi:cold shock protein